MLANDDRRLLTLAVDGELTPGERRQLDELLARSDEARQLLRQLEDDAARLRRLPTPALGVDLSAPVLAAIARRRVVAPRPRALSQPSPYPAWAGLAAAAAILLMLGTTSYVYFSGIAAPEDGPAVIAEGPPDVEPPQPDVGLAQGPAVPPGAPPDRPSPPSPRSDKPVQVAEDRKPAELHGPPVPESAAPVVTAPGMEPFEIKFVEVTPPVVFKLRELDQEATFRRLATELGKDTAFRVELPCNNASRAVERLQSAGRESHLGLIVESAAAQRLRLPALKSHYAVYADDLTPDELAGLLRQLGLEDKRAHARRPPDSQFDRVVVSRLTKADREELGRSLGFDPGEPVSPRSVGPLGTDPSRPLPELTAAQVSQSIAGQGGTPRPEPGKTAVKPPQHTALVVPFGVARARSGSAEVKRFLDGRKPVRAGTLQVFLVLRTVN